MTLLAAALAALIGLTLGVMGGGGSILTVPVLVYVLGFDPKDAIAASLVVVGATSLFGAVGHWRAGNVNLRVAAIFGVVAMGGAYLGARLSAHMSGAAQLTLFAGVMLLASWFMFRRRQVDVDADGAEPAVHDMSLGLIVAEGIAVGVLAGVVGVGGGFLIVPGLVLLGKLPMRQAVGTSLLVIAMNSAAGFAGYWGQVTVRWDFLAAFTAVAIAGILLGTLLTKRVPQHALQRAFAVFLLAMGTFILYQNRRAFLPGPEPVESARSSAAR